MGRPRLCRALSSWLRSCGHEVDEQESENGDQETGEEAGLRDFLFTLLQGARRRCELDQRSRYKEGEPVPVDPGGWRQEG